MEQSNLECGLSHPTMRDPLTTILSFLPNPGPLRLCSKFFVEVYDHSLYLEVDQHTPSIAFSLDNSNQVALSSHAPILFERISSGRVRIAARPLVANIDPPTGVLAHRVLTRLCVVDVLWLKEFSLDVALPRCVSRLELRNLPLLEKISGGDSSGGVSALYPNSGLSHPNLTHLVLQDLPALQEVGKSVPSHAIFGGLQHFSFTGDVSSLLTTMDDDFLSKLPLLQEIVFSPTMRNLKRIERRCLSECGSLQSFRVSQAGLQAGLPLLQEADKENSKFTRAQSAPSETCLASLVSFGDYFLSNCTMLKEVVIEDLPAFSHMLDCTLRNCSSLTSVKLRRLPVLEAIMDDVLFNCTQLVDVELSELPSLTLIGDYFLGQAHSLEVVTFANLPLLAEVGPSWLDQCVSLKTAVFENLPNLASVQAGWLSECRALELLRFTALPSLRIIGEEFLDNHNKAARLEVADGICSWELQEEVLNKGGCVEEANKEGAQSH